MAKFPVKNLGALLCFFLASSQGFRFSDLLDVDEPLDVYLLRDALCSDHIVFRNGVVAFKGKFVTYILEQDAVDSMRRGMCICIRDLSLYLMWFSFKSSRCKAIRHS